MNLREAKFSVIDLETTGLNLLKDEILSIAIVPMKGTKIMAGESYYTFVKPSNYDLKSMKFHGIDPKTLKQAPSFSEISEEVRERIEDSIIVGHAVEIDLNFLKKAFKAQGIELNNKSIDIALLEKWLCDRLGERKCTADLSLDALIRDYNLSMRFRHDALADAFLTAQIFQIQLLKLMKYGLTSVERVLSAIESTKMSRIDFIF
ncbi:MAG: 3'-5' exonuclease [Archaeoglobus sp.]|nr:3'-5' exonuclease [Archaeoglobus sp.]